MRKLYLRDWFATCVVAGAGLAGFKAIDAQSEIPGLFFYPSLFLLAGSMIGILYVLRDRLTVGILWVLVGGFMMVVCMLSAVAYYILFGR